MEKSPSLPLPLAPLRLVGSRARRECRAISSRIAREYIERGRTQGGILPRVGDVGEGKIERACRNIPPPPLSLSPPVLPSSRTHTSPG